MKTTTHEETSKGVVLKTTPYKENDLLVHVYTQEFGKITLLAKGARKMTSKNAPSVLPLTLSTFEMNLRPGISPLMRGTPDNYYKHIKETIECEIVADYLLEYYYRYIGENVPSQEDYRWLLGTLDALEKGYSYLLVYAMINSYIMKSNGVDIEVDHCALCESTKAVAFSLENGGFVCNEHRTPRDQILSVDAMKAMRHIYKRQIEDIDKIKVEDAILLELLPIFEYYIDEYCGIHLKSKKFIEQIV